MCKSLQWLAGLWAERIGPALSAMTGMPVQAQTGTAAPGPGPAPDALVWELTIGPLRAPLWIAVDQQTWVAAGREVLKTAGIETSDEAEARSAFLEVLHQSAGQLAEPLSARIGQEVELPAGTIRAEAVSDAEWAEIEIRMGEGPPGSAWLAAGAPLLAALEPENGPPSQAIQPRRETPAAASGRPSRTLDLLMEVELPVGVTFGRAQMRLKDAIKLTSGSIVELNRTIVEPVEIIVNNCVIARGEVVVVEGNYGVRIQEIVSREERLRTLF